MNCTKCNYESLNLNAKFCIKCGSKLIQEKHFCSNCGNKISYKSNFCGNCGKKINYEYIENSDSKINNMYTKDKEEDTTKETKDNSNILIIEKKNNNGGDFVNMENNITQKNYLEILPNQSIVEKNNTNLLPVLKSDKNSLLPVIIKSKELALIEIKEDFNKLKKERSEIGLLKFAKNLAILLAKFVRFCFLTTASVIGFVGVAVLIIASTAIITKNIVNSYYGITPEPDTTYSIFKMKDDKINAQSPPKN